MATPEYVPQHLHRYLLDAFDIRQIGDYGAPGMVGEKRAERVLVQAREFIEVLKHSSKPRRLDTGSKNL
jgi:uncharacterized protein (UPF0332 family)